MNIKILCMVSLGFLFPIFFTDNQLACAINEVDFFFESVVDLKKNDKWENIVLLGEQALDKGDLILTQDQKFEIIDQLISSYFRLGNFEKARKKATDLINLGNEMQRPELIIDSLYKYSAAIRGQAGRGDNNQKELFNEARKYVNKAKELCCLSCPENNSLMAKVLFNAGAAECDDPDGNILGGIRMYGEALMLFKETKEEDYYNRTQIRLGKAYLLSRDFNSSWNIIEELSDKPLEIRTLMHLKYLKAQVLLDKNLIQEAIKVAKEGIGVAKELKAEEDIRRFTQLIDLKS